MASAPTVANLLEGSSLFDILKPAHRSALARQARSLTLAPGQVLFTRGDRAKDIYVVEEGRVRLSVFSLDGRELSFAHAIPGDLFGEIGALDGAPRSADATAITCVRLKALPQQAFNKLLLKESAVALAVIKLLCARVRELSRNYEAITFHPVDVRLSRLLLGELAERHPTTPAVVTTLTLEMSQTDLALLIGTTRQRANAALARLENVGAIHRHGNMLECDVPALRKLARLD